MTVLEAIQRSTEFLKKKEVDSPRLQAELLLAHVLKRPRMALYLQFEQPLLESEIGAMRELVRRRGQREPLQYILGAASFCGFDILVNRAVLIPRPETELLAERAWQFLQQRCSSPESPLRVLDFGTGSGCIAIAVARNCPVARICALDISGDALELARQNALANSVAPRIEFVRGQDFGAIPSGKAFDLIVSNPPYIPDQEVPCLQPEVREHEPRHALAGGTDGLDFYRMFASRAAALLQPTGRLMVEFGDGQAESLRGIFENENWVVEQIQHDYTQRPRILVAYGQSAH